MSDVVKVSLYIHVEKEIIFKEFPTTFAYFAFLHRLYIVHRYIILGTLVLPLLGVIPFSLWIPCQGYRLMVGVHQTLV